LSKKDTRNKKIRELEKRIKRLEDYKEILNTAIDIADKMLNTDIRKKYLSLLCEKMPTNSRLKTKKVPSWKSS
jgi:hypothetical protein